jgi:carbon-monoxide dehydrogenase medium subunit
MDLAIVGVAAVVVAEDRICKDIRIALGAVAPTPIRARQAEDILRGQKLSSEVIERAAQIASGECYPITDRRASEEYRCHMVEVLTKRAIQQAIS